MSNYAVIYAVKGVYHEKICYTYDNIGAFALFCCFLCILQELQ